MKARKTLLIISLMGVIAFCLAGSTFAASVRSQLSQESAIEQAVRRGTLKVGMSTFVPWAMKDKTGQLIGFEIDVARRLAKDLGLKIQFVPTKWSGIIPALLTGKFDVIIGGMSIRADRNLKVNFSIPYDYSGMSIVAGKAKAAGFSTLADFNKPEVVVAVRLGSTAASAAKKYLPKAQLRQFDDESQAVQELLNGRAHAFVSSAPTPAYLAINNADKLFMPFKETFTKEPIGFAVRKSDVDTLNVFNSWISVVWSEGWLQERHDYWFGSRDWEKLIK